MNYSSENMHIGFNLGFIVFTNNYLIVVTNLIVYLAPEDINLIVYFSNTTDHSFYQLYSVNYE